MASGRSRQIQWPFTLSVLGGLVVVAGALYALREFQVRRNIDALRAEASSYEREGKLDKALENMSLYLAYRPDDGEAWADYARWLDRNDPLERRRESRYLAFAEALRQNEDDHALLERAAELALELDRPADARRHYRVLYASAAKDSEGNPQDAALEEQLGRCDLAEAKHQEAADWFRKSIAHDTTRVSAYLALASVLRDGLKQPQAAEQVLDEMVAANPRSGRALVLRWRQRGVEANVQADASVDAKDVERAYELEPIDVEVLRASGQVALQLKNYAQARERYATAAQLDPKNIAVVIERAAVEQADNQPQQAIALLRAAMAAHPARIEVPLYLLDVLIDEGQLETKDGARALLAELRGRGLIPGMVAYYEARMLMKQRRWGDALKPLAAARARLAADAVMSARVNAMMAECHARLNRSTEWLADIERAAREANASVEARELLARALAETGKLDDAIRTYTFLLPERPGAELEIIRLLTRKQLALPADKRRFNEINARLAQASNRLPGSSALLQLQAEVLLAQNRLEDARTLLAKATATDPQEAAYPILLASTLQGLKQPAQAFSVLDEAERKIGRSLELELARLELGLRGDEATAKAAVDRLSSTWSAWPVENQELLLDRLGAAQLRIGENAAARATLTTLFERQPDNFQLALTLTDLAIQVGDHESAHALAAKVRDLEGQEGWFAPFIKGSIALDLARRGQQAALARVRESADALVRAHPNWWGGSVLLAGIAEFEERPDRAVEHYMRAIELGNNQPDLARRLVGLLYQRQRFEDIDKVVAALSDRGTNLSDLRLVSALNALRRDDLDRGLELARGILSEASENYADQLFLGRMYVYSGRMADAEKRFQRAVELAPAEPATWIDLIDLLARQDRLEEARSRLTEMEKAVPAEERTAALAQAHDRIGQVEEAERLFTQALADKPNDLPLLRQAAEFALRRRRNERAAELLKTLLDPAAKAPVELASWARRAQSMLEVRTGSLEQIDEALKAVNANLRQNPYSFEDQRARALLLAMRPSSRTEAIAALEALEKTRLLSIDERFLLAMLYAAQRDLDRCEAQMLQLLKGPRQYPVHLAYMAALQSERGRVAEARRWLTSLRALEPQGLRAVEIEAQLLELENKRAEIQPMLATHLAKNPDQSGTIAALFERHGFIPDAERAYRAYVAANPSEPGRMLDLIDFLGRQKRVSEALDLCEQVRGSVPAEAVLGVAVAAVSAPSATDADRERVEAWLHSAREQDPDSPVLKVKLANLRLLQGRSAESQSLYSEVLASAPDDLESLNNLAWRLAFQEGQGQEALRLVNRAIENFGALPALLDTRAVVYLRMGQPEPALRDLREALSATAQIPVLYFHLAWAHSLAGNASEARAALLQAEKLGLTPEATDPLEREAYLQLRGSLQL